MQCPLPSQNACKHRAASGWGDGLHAERGIANTLRYCNPFPSTLLSLSLSSICTEDIRLIVSVHLSLSFWATLPLVMPQTPVKGRKTRRRKVSQLWIRHFLRLKVGECGEHVSRNSWDQFVQILSWLCLLLSWLEILQVSPVFTDACLVTCPPWWQHECVVHVGSSVVGPDSLYTLLAHSHKLDCILWEWWRSVYYWKPSVIEPLPCIFFKLQHFSTIVHIHLRSSIVVVLWNCAHNKHGWPPHLRVVPAPRQCMYICALSLCST